MTTRSWGFTRRDSFLIRLAASCGSFGQLRLAASAADCQWRIYSLRAMNSRSSFETSEAAVHLSENAATMHANVDELELAATYFIRRNYNGVQHKEYI